jgi:opacity protein-like surface antigen
MKKSFYLFLLLSIFSSKNLLANENSMTGFKLGLSAGYANTGLSRGDFKQYIPDLDNTISFGIIKKRESALHIGTSIGYGYTFKNNLHIGAEYAFSNIFDRLSSGLTSSDPDIDSSLSSTAVSKSGNSYLHSFSSIIGYEYKIQKHILMPFAKAGYSLMHTNISIAYGNSRVIPKYGHGFNIGGGLMYSPHKNVFASLEYVYHRLFYGKNNVNSLLEDGSGSAFVQNLTSDVHILKATVGFKFNI